MEGEYELVCDLSNHSNGAISYDPERTYPCFQGHATLWC